jgi:hypothetical protein
MRDLRTVTAAFFVIQNRPGTLTGTTGRHRSQSRTQEYEVIDFFLLRYMNDSRYSKFLIPVSRILNDAIRNYARNSREFIYARLCWTRQSKRRAPCGNVGTTIPHGLASCDNVSTTIPHGLLPCRNYVGTTIPHYLAPCGNVGTTIPHGLAPCGNVGTTIPHGLTPCGNVGTTIPHGLAPCDNVGTTLSCLPRAPWEQALRAYFTSIGVPPSC